MIGIVKLILRRKKRLANKIFGTQIDELYWKFRHIFDKEWAKSYISEGSINHPHRKILIDRISVYYPFESALEVGCASGPNLYLLAERFPKAQIYGIDISYKAIKAGQDFFKKENIKNIVLKSGKVEDMKNFQDKSIDVIFTDAVLIYEGPDKINFIIKEMLRIAKKAIILCEQHQDSSLSFYQDHWIHNYKSLFSEFIPEEKIKTRKIPMEMWTGNWGKFGYIIEAIL